MDTALIIAIFVAALVVLIALVVITRRRTDARNERLRDEASEHRDLAEVSRLEVERQRAAADEQAARARQDALAAEQAQLEADRQAQEVADLHARADELDPDVEVDERDRGDVEAEVTDERTSPPR